MKLLKEPTDLEKEQLLFLNNSILRILGCDKGIST